MCRFVHYTASGCISIDISDSLLFRVHHTAVFLLSFISRKANFLKLHRNLQVRFTHRRQPPAMMISFVVRHCACNSDFIVCNLVLSAILHYATHKRQLQTGASERFFSGRGHLHWGLLANFQAYTDSMLICASCPDVQN